MIVKVLIRLVALSLLVLIESLVGREATATIIVPVSDRDLAEQAVAVVIGEVTAIESHWDPGHQQVFSYITLHVDEVLKGDLGTGPLTIRQVGGTVRGFQSWVHGSPEFTVGERVLLFLRSNPDGTLRVAHLHQGRFSVLADLYSGQGFAHRSAAPYGVHVMGGSGHAHVPIDAVHDLETFKRRIRGFAKNRARVGSRVIAAAVPPSGGVTETGAEFTFLGSPARWFEPDSGAPVTMFMNSEGEPTAPTRGFDQVRAAFAAWSANAAFRYADGGLTTAAGFQRDGVNAISFRDPLGQMDPPTGCGGTLAIGGYFRSSETRTVNGTTFYRILEGDLVGNSGWEGCGVNENFDRMAEWLTHELGHVLGLGHSADRDATMYAYAHFDGRGASLRSDDVAGLVFMYPGATPPPPPPPASFALTISRTGAGAGTVRATGIDCGTDCSESYAIGTRVTLTAAPATGFSFAGWSGGGCSGVGECTVVMSVNTAVAAAFSVPSVAPDLVEAALSNPPASARVSTTFIVTDTVRNQGTALAPPSTTRYFLSLDRRKSSRDRLLTGTRSVPALTPGQESSGTVSVRIPAGVAPGAYFVIACADNLKVVTESSDKKNCLASATKITVTP